MGHDQYAVNRDVPTATSSQPRRNCLGRTLHLRRWIGHLSHFVALQLQPGSISLTDDSPGEVLSLDDDHPGWAYDDVVGIAAAGNWQVVDDDVVCLELCECIRDDLLAARTGSPPRCFGFGRAAACD
jgi:hypothetical protein